MALCALSFMDPEASHVTRRVPVSLVNDSVCRLPLPDHDPSECQTTLRSVGGGGSLDLHDEGNHRMHRTHRKRFVL